MHLSLQGQPLRLTCAKPPGHCCYLLCQTLQTPQEVRDSAATTLKDVHPAVKSQGMYFLSCHLFLTCVQMCSEARTGCEQKHSHRRPQRVIWGGRNQLIRGFLNYSQTSLLANKKTPLTFYHKFLITILCSKINHSFLR